MYIYKYILKHGNGIGLAMVIIPQQVVTNYLITIASL